MSLHKEIEQKIPPWANWQSRDCIGRLWVWSHPPLLETYQGREIWGVQDVPDSRCECMTEGGPQVQDWRTTLEQVNG